MAKVNVTQLRQNLPEYLARVRAGEPVVVMGPTGTPTEIPHGETVVLAGGGLGNAVLFSIGRALRAAGSRVIYFAGYKRASDRYRVEDIEAASDVVVWCCDEPPGFAPRRAQDRAFVGNIVKAMEAYASGKLGPQELAFSDTDAAVRCAVAIQRAIDGHDLAEVFDGRRLLPDRLLEATVGIRGHGWAGAHFSLGDGGPAAPAPGPSASAPKATIVATGGPGKTAPAPTRRSCSAWRMNRARSSCAISTMLLSTRPMRSMLRRWPGSTNPARFVVHWL